MLEFQGTVVLVSGLWCARGGTIGGASGRLIGQRGPPVEDMDYLAGGFELYVMAVGKSGAELCITLRWRLERELIS